jgi:hypothetical protein
MGSLWAMRRGVEASMSDTPKVLDMITDVVLAYKPEPKTKATTEARPQGEESKRKGLGWEIMYIIPLTKSAKGRNDASFY